ncbi:hypothetical protein KUTeg_024874 [Tegillarca granosa]|uniref:Uncharacterized protein n=1 Tax=Tegillarca granosa TaxID=220873 RepID=A0ABQ9DYK7_TEGGR|nr:hypothetical protein KUTeg_024874 [Tegillarca granosa]
MSRGTGLIVAAIDFGTTYSGYAFSMRHEYEKDKLKISANNWMAGSRGLVSLKTPTAVLLNPKKEFDSFGFEAEDKYSDLADDDEHHGWYYFRRFKMMLHDKFDEVDGEKGVKGAKKNKIKRNIMLKDVTGEKEMPAIDIFAMAIRYLKNHLLSTCEKRADMIKEDDVTWVLTVPAIWNDAAKQFMREAAEKAEIKGDHLLIALEPEAASMFCKHVPVEKMCSETGFASFAPGSKYLVLDAGGGTVDITVHEVAENDHLRELHKASGGAWGGTQVDESFRQMLVRIVGGPVWNKFCSRHTGDFVDMFREFETKKRNINEATTGKVTMKIPVTFAEQFQEETEEDIKEVIEQTNFSGKISWFSDKTRINADLFKNLFEEASQNIVVHLRELLSTKEVKDTKTILMVGGFSESPILQSRIRREFPDMRVIIPPDAGLAVLKGAVLFGYDPKTIEERIAKYTYGIATTDHFDPKKHDASKKKNINGRDMCSDVFHKHVTKGQVLRIDEVQSEENYYPIKPDQTAINFTVYISPNLNPKYVTDNDCEEMGQMDVDIPDITDGLKRCVIVKMIFGGTELHLEAMVKKTGKVTKAKFNFLGND